MVVGEMDPVLRLFCTLSEVRAALGIEVVTQQHIALGNMLLVQVESLLLVCFIFGNSSYSLWFCFVCFGNGLFQLLQQPKASFPFIVCLDAINSSNQILILIFSLNARR